MRRAVELWDRRQVLLYLFAIAIGVRVGTGLPEVAPTLERAINPALGLLLFATFLGIPLMDVRAAFRDVRFLTTVMVANFVVIPVIAYLLSRLVADDQGLLVGVLLVLLTPCVDYVIVFAGLAGGARAQLLAATPLLMVTQMVLLPGYLFLFVGADVLAVVEIRPFVEAFVMLIVIPLAAASIVQTVSRRHRVGRVIEDVMAGAMVPLMMVTLAVVVGSQIAAVGSQASTLGRVVPVYVVFVVAALVVGGAAARLGRLDVARTRAVIFSVITRNSLVVLPLALALPASFAITPLAVVTQTLVELVAMVVLVWLVPRLAPERQSHSQE